MRAAALVLGLVVLSCGGGETPKSTAAGPLVASDSGVASASGDAAAIPVAPFKLIPTTKPERAIDVKADGTAYVGSKLVMKFVDNELRSAEGQTILSLAKDGTVTLHRKDGTEETVGNLNDKDEFSPKREESRRMWLDDKGTLKLLGAPDPEPGKEAVRFEGVGPTNRRAAMLTTVLFLTARADGSAKSDAGAPAGAASGRRP